MTSLLDRHVAARSVVCRRRPSDPWFDDECRVGKRLTRKLERAAGLTNPTDVAAATAANAAWTVQRRTYLALRRQKREQFWRSKVDAERSDPRQLWRSIDVLLSRGRVPSCDAIGPTEFHRAFDGKVNGMRSLTADVPPPTFTPVTPGFSLSDFRPLTTDDVVAAVRQFPDKHSASDPVPTDLLKDNVYLLASFLVTLLNLCLSLGSVPPSFKAAYVTPLLKKPDLDLTDPKSYRPIANLSVLSKLLERPVARQLLNYLNASRLLPERQAAYRAYHFTETAVTKVLGDILLALDKGEIAMLTQLDLSAAFDTVDHAILLRLLEVSYGLGGAVLSWFKSYLDDRPSSSAEADCHLIRLFLLYTADVLRLIERHNLHPHGYADDTQVYGFCQPSSCLELREQMPVCLDEVALSMRSNRLQLNTSKTEVL